MDDCAWISYENPNLNHIISHNWSMDFYQLPTIIANSYPMTSLAELWNPSLYREETIYNLTKQIHCSNFESLIYGPIVRFSINRILEIQSSKLMWYITHLCISVLSYIVKNFFYWNPRLKKGSSHNRVALNQSRGFHNHAVIPICHFIFIHNLNHPMTSSNGNIFRVTGHLCEEFTGPRWIPSQKPVTRSLDVFFDLRPNKRLSKQSWGWWFGTPSRSLWRHCNNDICWQNKTKSLQLPLFSLFWQNFMTQATLAHKA